MDLLKNLFPFSDFLYLLQLEEYFSRFYFRDLKRFFFRRNLQKRDTLKYTSRIQTTLAVSIGFFITGALLFSLPPSNILFGFLISSVLIPVWIGIANIILTPVYNSIRGSVQNRAQKLVSSKSHQPKVIAVAGSYGKTTVKNIVFQMIRYSYKTQVIPGNINTPTGIAAWLLKNYDETADYLIVEMDTYEVGEIQKSCTILPPDIAILTNVGDQHLMRFKSKKELARALEEVFTYAKPGAIKIDGRKIQSKKSLHPNELVNLNIPIAQELARLLKIPKEFADDALDKFAIPERRGNLVKMNGFDVIDNSYNISPTTAKTGLIYSNKLARKMKRKLVVITAGIPELGSENKNANIEYGKVLEQYADKAFILKSILYQDLIKAMSPKNFKLMDSLAKAWEEISKDYNEKRVLILLQPELNDLYY